MNTEFARAFPGGADALRLAIQERISYAKQPLPLTSDTQYSRFDALGKIVQCPPSLLLSFGTGDDEKRICGNPRAYGETCTVISVGSNNQWGFELEINERYPSCTIHTLDCTVAAEVPARLAKRLVYHNVCLSESDHERHGQRFMSWPSFVSFIQLKAAPLALKMDIEGFEWGVLRSMISSQTPLPFSLSVELHTWTEVRDVEWYGTWRSAVFVKEWMDEMVDRGYFLVDRHDNPKCSYCSEIVLARLAKRRLLKRSLRQIPAAQNPQHRTLPLEASPEAASFEICKRCSRPLSRAPSIYVVTTHYRESLSWVMPVLSDNPSTHVFIYECGVRRLSDSILSHSRVVVRDKGGRLATRDPFYSFFDHVYKTYEALPDYTLFLHGHDTHYHRNTPIRQMLLQAYQIVSRQPVNYLNVGDAVHSTWLGCSAIGDTRRALGVRLGSDEYLRPTPDLCTLQPPCASMPKFVALQWPLLTRALSVHNKEPPLSIAEINGNEALVARCRLRSRPLSVWEALRNLTEEHHSQLAFALEGSFHFIMGEPWIRPFISRHQQHINFVACGANATSTLWPGAHPELSSPVNLEFAQLWLRYTELSLRVLLPSSNTCT